MKSTIKIPRGQVANVFKEYGTIALLTADQANQSSNRIYKVIDASADTNITFKSGETKKHAYYEYKEVATGSIDDYTLISAPYGNHSGGGGAENYIELLDKETVDLPTINTPLNNALNGKMDNADVGPVRIFNQDPLTTITATGTSWNSFLGTQKIELTAAQVAAGKSYSIRIFGKISTTNAAEGLRKFRAVITAGGDSESQEAHLNTSIVTEAHVDIDGIFDFGGTTASTLVGFYGSGMLLKADGLSPIGFRTSAENSINATNGITIDLQFQGAFAEDVFTSRKIQVLDINNQVILTVGSTPVPSYETETIDYMTAIGIPNDSATYYSTLKNSDVWDIIDTYVKAEKANGSFQFFDYPMIGNTATQHSYNLVDTSKFQITWNGDWIHSELGAKGNGTNTYARTGFVPDDEQDVNSNGLSYVSGTDLAEPKPTTIPIGTGITGTNSSLIATNKSSSPSISTRMNLNYIDGSTSTNSGVVTAVRQSNTVTKLFKDGSLLGSGDSGGTLSTYEVILGTHSVNGAIQTFYSVQRFQSFKAHIGLTDAQVLQHHENINAREAALLRKTW